MKIRTISSGMSAILSVFLLLLACSCSQKNSETYVDPTHENTETTPLPVSDIELENPEQIPPASDLSIEQLLPAETPASEKVSSPAELMKVNESTFEEKTDHSTIEYSTQSGDTLYAIAAHFNVPPDQIKAVQPSAQLNGYIETGTLVQLPKRIDEFGPADKILPDSEVVYSMSAHDFDIQYFIKQAEGYLGDYEEAISNGSNKSHQVIQHVALNNSINPRLLLTVLQYQSNWVYGSLDIVEETEYPMQWFDLSRQGLNLQLNWAADQLNAGYYSWRDGSLTELEFPDGSTIRLAPTLNAGTVAIQYLMARLYNQDKWYEALYGTDGIKALHEIYFGDPWERAISVEPLIPPDLEQPIMVLPFQESHGWNLTGGPHPAWGPGSPWGALDFAPTGVSGCEFSAEWVTSAAPGLVTRTESGLVMVDLDGDGYEQSGWNLLYMHIFEQESAEVGEFVYINDLIGHPSCSGGSSTGTHVHLARKFNGEWIPADGPVPFVLSGWQAYAGSEPYAGKLFKNGLTINASTCSDATSLIVR